MILACCLETMKLLTVGYRNIESPMTKIKPNITLCLRASLLLLLLISFIVIISSPDQKLSKSLPYSHQELGVIWKRRMQSIRLTTHYNYALFLFLFSIRADPIKPPPITVNRIVPIPPVCGICGPNVFSTSCGVAVAGAVPSAIAAGSE